MRFSAYELQSFRFVVIRCECYFLKLKDKVNMAIKLYLCPFFRNFYEPILYCACILYSFFRVSFFFWFVVVAYIYIAFLQVHFYEYNLVHFFFLLFEKLLSFTVIFPFFFYCFFTVKLAVFLY